MPRSQQLPQRSAHVPTWHGALWWRLGPRGRRLLVGGLIVVLAVGAGERMIRPLVRGYRTADEVRRLEAEYASLVREQRELRAELELLQTPEGQALIGKRMGLYRAKERELRFDVQRLEEIVAAAEQPPVPQSWGASLRAALDGAAQRGRHCGHTLALWLLDLRTEDAVTSSSP